MKRNLLSFILVFSLLFSLSVSAFATEVLPETPLQGELVEVPSASPIQPVSPTPGITPVPPIVATESATLEIDTQHRYGGMDKAYKDGYAPKIENGNVRIVIPLLSIGKMRDNRIKASLQLGDGTASPIVVANYEKMVVLSRVVPEGETQEQELFLVEFMVPLSENRKNGVYPVTVKFSGYDLNSNAVDSEYTVYVTISDVAPEVIPTPPPPVVSGPSAEPVVYISKYVMEPETAVAGEEFTLTLTLRNSLTSKTISNLLVTVEPKDLRMTLLEDSNVIPIGRLKAGGETELVLHFRPEPNIPEEKHIINLNFAYNTGTGMGLSSSGNCIIDVRQPAKLSYDGAKLPVKVFQEDIVSVSMHLMNTGKSTLYNCMVEFEIESMNSGGSVFIGEIPAGESKPAQGNLRVSADALGEATGKIILRYEDAFGTEYEKTAEVSTKIEPKPEPVNTEQEKKQSGNKLWWLFLLLGLGVGSGAGFGIPWLIRDRKQRKEDDLRL